MGPGALARPVPRLCEGCGVRQRGLAGEDRVRTAACGTDPPRGSGRGPRETGDTGSRAVLQQRQAGGTGIRVQ